MINVTSPLLPPLNEYITELEEIWNSKWITNMGSAHKRLEQGLTNYLGVKNLELFVNGHLALELALQAFDLKGEVITTPFTFVSTSHAIKRNGLTPVFCDIKTDDYTIDVDKIESLITDKTTAIVPVHVYGHICETEKIEKIAKKHNLKVIYDAAHAFGVSVNGQGVGNLGDASMFSFHATKVFNCIEGGAVTFNNHINDIKTKLYNLKNFGIQSPEIVEAIGCNAKMNEFQAAMGICNLKIIDESIQKRKQIYTHYYERLSNIDGIKINSYSNENIKYNYAYLPILIDENKYGINRDKLANILLENDIYARKYFYPLISNIECYNCKQTFENAEYVSKNILTLPIYPDLTLKQVDLICDIIKQQKN